MRILEHCFRIYCGSAALDKTVAFYEALQQVACTRRVTIAETGVIAAKVGAFLILAGDGEAMSVARQVDGIFYVDDLAAFASRVEESGGELLHPARAVTGGRNFTARHPDGLVIEYFEAARKNL